MSAALTWQKTYPVEGDSAVAELLIDGRVWGEIALDNLRLDQKGAARLTGARAVLRLHGSLDDLDLEEALSSVAQAREWLIENEQGREPEHS